MAKINRYDCDLCGAPIENGREVRIRIRYPIPDEVKIATRLDRGSRKERSVELCTRCFEEKLPEFVTIQRR